MQNRGLTYSKKSASRLKQCHNDIQTIFGVVLALGYDHTALEGHRAKAEQNAAFESGRSKARWGQSLHNTWPSKAVDVSPFPIPKHWGDKSRNEYEKFRYFAMYVLGVADMLYGWGEIEHRLRWGGDWDGDKDVTDQNFNDLVHFELTE